MRKFSEVQGKKGYFPKMPLICFSLVWFPSFKTDINLLSKEAFLGAEQMPAESWNLTLSRQPAGSTHPLL